MDNIKIVKNKFRRGTNEERLSTLVDQGEPVFTLDTKRVFIGTGVTGTSVVVGSKNHTPLVSYNSLSTLNSEVGDIVKANNKLYQLTSSNYTAMSSWSDLGPSLDDNLFYYDNSNNITLYPESLSSLFLNPNTVSNGVKIDSEILQLDFNPKSLELSAAQLSLKADGIDEREISSTSLSSGLKGGSGSKLELDIDPTYFVFSGNKLSLSASPTTLEFTDLDSIWFGSGLNYSVGEELITTVLTDVDSTTISKDGDGIVSINPSIFGSGLYYNTLSATLSATLTDVDNNTIVKNGSGVISLSVTTTPTTVDWPQITIDAYGRVASLSSSIYEMLQGDSSQSSLNSNNSLSSIFNGSPTINGVYDGFGELTQFLAISTNAPNGGDTATVILSSAGFITFEEGVETRLGHTLRRFAIPIFTY